jgi:hypothetical protein
MNLPVDAMSSAVDAMNSAVEFKDVDILFAPE